MYQVNRQNLTSLPCTRWLMNVHTLNEVTACKQLIQVENSTRLQIKAFVHVKLSDSMQIVSIFIRVQYQLFTLMYTQYKWLEFQ